MKTFLFFSLVNFCVFSQELIREIAIKGHRRVEADAIRNILTTETNRPLDPKKVADDIRSVFALGYFSNIEVAKEPMGDGIRVTYQVEEKPAISAIAYEGMEEISEDDLKDKISSKLFTIVNEAAIQKDAGVIEKLYVDKGYYLVNVNYRFEKVGEYDVKLVFVVDESAVMRVAQVDILGNEYFSDNDIITKMALRPITRLGNIFGSGSLFKEDELKRDQEFLAYYYKDNGFQDVKVARPLLLLDRDKKFARLQFSVEEGLQFFVGDIDVSGDLLFEKSVLFKKMKLQKGKLFRISEFQNDVEMLKNEYGDLGYAFADINPKTDFKRDGQPPVVNLNYEVAKGEKMYFGRLDIVGNTTTRDNVIRREFEVGDGELYSGTRLQNTKLNIERLGFFEEVQMIRSRDPEDPQLLNYEFRIKEKPTGQLNGSLGYQPGQSNGSQWFFQGKYNNSNQSGKGWNLGVSGRWTRKDDYEVSAEFSNPRLDDGPWSLGFGTSYSHKLRQLTSEIDVNEKRISGSVTLGRKIVELIRGSLSYRYTKIVADSESYIIERFREDGVSSSLIAAITRNSTNNYLEPTEGTKVTLSQNVTGGQLLGGDFSYMESKGDGALYVPVDFTDNFRTYFHLSAVFSHIYPYGDEAVPLTERYRLGGLYDLRGYPDEAIGPQFSILQNPNGFSTRINRGGDKKAVFQLEYFVPLIPEAGIKILAFADAGMVYDDSEVMDFSKLKYDYGYGFRWMTPVAPFRFEWAYPVDKDYKNMRFHFSLGF